MADGHPRVEGRIGILEDVLVLSVKAYLAHFRGLHPAHLAQDRGLSGTGLSDHTEDLPAEDVEVDAFQRLDFIPADPVGLVDIGQFDRFRVRRREGRPGTEVVFEVRHIVEELFRIVMGRGRQDAVRSAAVMSADRAGLHTVAVQQNADGVCHISRETEVVGDQQDGHAGLVPEPKQFIGHLFLRRDVQRGGHFIAEQEPRFQEHQKSDRHPLAHAAADFIGTAREDTSVGGKAQRLEDMEHFVFIEFSSVALQCFFELGTEGAEGIKGRGGVLRNEADLIAQQFPAFFVAHREDVVPRKRHAAAGHFRGIGRKAQQRFQDRGFSGTGLSGDAVDLPRCQFQRIVVERLKVPVGDTEVFHGEQALFPWRWTGSDGPDRFDLFCHSHHFASLTS